MRTKWTILPVFIIVVLFFFSCSAEKAIEQTIQDFEDAANDGDIDALKDTLSSHSEWDITGLQAEVLNTHLSGYTPLEYTDLTIEVDKPHADVESTALYLNTAPTTAWFIMREEDKFFSFLFPDWRIKEFYDLDNPVDAIWKKLKK